MTTETDIRHLPVAERGAWLATSSGQLWSILHPAPWDVQIEDVIIGMARCCRYANQIRPDVELFSVAEHSVLMAKYAIENGIAKTREDALLVLFHDAAEGYLGDMPTPMKKLLPDYKAIENLSQTAIMQHMGLDTDHKPWIKELDNRIRLDERPALINEPAMSEGLKLYWDEDGYDLEPLGVEIRCLGAFEARDAFNEMHAWIIENMPTRATLSGLDCPSP